MEDGNINESVSLDGNNSGMGLESDRVPVESSDGASEGDNYNVDSDNDAFETVPSDKEESVESEEVPSETSSGSAETETSSGSVADDGESDARETISVPEDGTETEVETETETETEKDTIEDILKDIQNTLSGNSVEGSDFGSSGGASVSSNSAPESVSGNNVMVVDYTDGLIGIQKSLDGLNATVTCIFIVVCLYFVKQSAKHIIKGFMGGR